MLYLVDIFCLAIGFISICGILWVIMYCLTEKSSQNTANNYTKENNSKTTEQS